MQHGDLLAEARGEAARGLRRERDLGHQHEHAAAARQRALGRAQVDLRLARAGHAVAAADRLRRPRAASRSRPPRRSGRASARRAAACARRVTVGTTRRASSVTRPSPARRRTVAAVVPARSTSSASGSGPSASSSSSARRRAVAPGTPVAETHVSRGAPHARRQRQRQRPRGRRAVVRRDPEAQLEHGRRDARRVGQALDERQLALVLRRPPASTTTPAHDAAGQRHVHDVARLQVELVRLQVVERLPQGAGGHQGNDADRAGHRGIMAHRVGATRARE